MYHVSAAQGVDERMTDKCTLLLYLFTVKLLYANHVLA